MKKLIIDDASYFVTVIDGFRVITLEKYGLAAHERNVERAELGEIVTAARPGQAFERCRIPSRAIR